MTDKQSNDLRLSSQFLAPINKTKTEKGQYDIYPTWEL